jgi:hypothetical protein
MTILPRGILFPHSLCSAGVAVLFASLACAQTGLAGHWEGVLAAENNHDIGLTLDLAKNAKSEWIASMAKKTLRQVEVSAAVVANQANQLEMIAGPESSPESHLAKLAVLKDEVNRMGQEMSSISGDRESLPPWEQQAIGKVLPLLRATAANTENAIVYFNENKNSLAHALVLPGT